jgi:hypothetical protein
VLDRPRDGAALGAVIGAIREAYLGRGWAVATASVAAGTSADRMPPWHVLVDAVALRSRARFAVETADEVAAHAPDRALLAAAVAEPPGGDGFRGAVLAMVELLQREPAPVAPSPEVLLHRSLDAVAVWLEEPQLGRRGDESAVPLGELVAVLVDLAAERWTWVLFDRCTHGDVFALAKAVARTLGAAPWVDAFDDVRAQLAAALDALIEPTWRTAALAVREAASAPATPLVDAIVALGDHAATLAARRLATAMRARWSRQPGEDPAGVCAEVLGDPRHARALWEAAAPAVVEALR